MIFHCVTNDFGQRRLWSIPAFFESVGQAAMDLGFSGVIEKFEDYWGKRATGWLLFLIGLAIAAVSLGAIWQWIVSPILVFFKSPLWVNTVAALFNAALIVGAGVTIGLWLSSAFIYFKRTRQLRKIVEDAETRTEMVLAHSRSLRDDVKSARENLHTETAKVHVMLQASILLAKAWLEQNPELSDDEREAALGRLGIAKEILAEAEAAGEQAMKAGEHEQRE